MLDPIFDFLASLLAFFYGTVWASYGMAIAFLTLAVMLVLTPLTVKGTRSMMAMSRLAPEMKKIQDKHKGDREKLNQELMAFYQEHKINPLGGCLPLLAQAPVLIVMFHVIRGLGHVNSEGVPDPKYLDESTALYQAIRADDGELFSWGMDLSISPLAAIQAGSVLGALPYLALIALVGLTAWYSTKQIQARSAGQQQNPQMQMVNKIMPFFLPAISFNLPAGLVVYFFVSNGFRIGQQEFIRRIDAREAATGGNGRRPPKDGDVIGEADGAEQSTNGQPADAGGGAPATTKGNGSAAGSAPRPGKAGAGKAGAAQTSAQRAAAQRQAPSRHASKKKKRKKRKK